MRSLFEAPSASSISASSTSCNTARITSFNLSGFQSSFDGSAGGLTFCLDHGGVPSRESVTLNTTLS